MKLLHTSDWHLGQYFMGKSRQQEHQAFIVWFVEQVQKHNVDAVVIAGDIFDTGSPPSYARELYNQLIVKLNQTGTQLIILAGNHDSISVLDESKSLVSHLNTKVISSAMIDLDDAVIEIVDKSNVPCALLCAIPFLRSKDLITSQAGQTATQKQQSLQNAIKEHYQNLFDVAKSKQKQIQKKHTRHVPIIATGHLTSVGASSSESVREIYVGSLETFPTNAFPAADYIALGHIHKAQKVGGLEHIRYCGSPIALSFDEAKQTKQLLLVELDHNGLNQVEPITVPTFQALASLSGSLEELTLSIPERCKQLEEGKHLWLELTIGTDDYLNDLQQRIEDICRDLPCELLRLRRQRTEQQSMKQIQKETLAELSPQDVFVRRLQEENLDAETELKLKQLYKQVSSKISLGEHS